MLLECKNKEKLCLNEVTVKESSKYKIISTKNVEKQALRE